MNKKQLVNLDFEGKQKLVSPVLDAEYADQTDGELVYGNAAKPNKVAIRRGGQLRSILDEADISNNADFTTDGGLLASRTAILNLVNSIVSSVGQFKGVFDASTGTAPTGASIVAGDYYRVSVAGTLTGLINGPAVQVGDIIVSNISNPQGNADYFALQANFSSSDDIPVGGTFTPQAGAITGADSVKVALQKLNSAATAAGNQNLQSVMNLGPFAVIPTQWAIDSYHNIYDSSIRSGFSGTGTEAFVEVLENEKISVVEVKADTIQIQLFTWPNPVAWQRIRLNRNGGTGILVEDSIANKGLTYAGDYSANNTGANNNPRWIPDKAYVDAQAALGLSKVKATITGNGTNSTFVVTHNKNDKDVIVQVRDNVTDELVDCAVKFNLNNVEISFSYVPTNSETFRVVII
jgi:hypothetical protein